MAEVTDLRAELETARLLREGPCIHSVQTAGCVGCLQMAIDRQTAELETAGRRRKETAAGAKREFDRMRNERDEARDALARRIIELNDSNACNATLTTGRNRALAANRMLQNAREPCENAAAGLLCVVHRPVGEWCEWCRAQIPILMGDHSKGADDGE